MEKITDACKEAQLPAPQFIERSGGILVELRRNPETLGHTKERVSERTAEDFGIEQGKSFEIICLHPEFSAEQIADQLDKTPRTIENYIAKLKAVGIIERKGPKLGGHWEVIGEKNP